MRRDPNGHLGIYFGLAQRANKMSAYNDAIKCSQRGGDARLRLGQTQRASDLFLVLASRNIFGALGARTHRMDLAWTNQARMLALSDTHLGLKNTIKQEQNNSLHASGISRLQAFGFPKALDFRQSCGAHPRSIRKTTKHQMSLGVNLVRARGPIKRCLSF